MSRVDQHAGETWSQALRTAAVMLAVFTATTIAYTAAVAALGSMLGGSVGESLALDSGRVAAWAGPEWFHGRPAAATGGVSGGSNLGPTNPVLVAAVGKRVAAVRAENPTHVGPIPVDLVTASGSGLDPHVSPPAALLQVPRVAAARGLPESDVRRLVERSIEPRALGVFGQPRVNVVRLNAALEALADRTEREGRSGSP